MTMARTEDENRALTGPSLTTAQAAATCGMPPSTFRRQMSRERKAGRDFRLPGPYPDRPMWDEAALRAWLAARPGRGNWRRNTPDGQGVTKPPPP